MLKNLTIMLENILMYKETGQITNPKLQISNKLQIPNINTKSQTKKAISFLLFVDLILFSRHALSSGRDFQFGAYVPCPVAACMVSGLFACPVGACIVRGCLEFEISGQSLLGSGSSGLE